jgi:hypothetical protein
MTFFAAIFVNMEFCFAKPGDSKVGVDKSWSASITVIYISQVKIKLLRKNSKGKKFAKLTFSEFSAEKSVLLCWKKKFSRCNEVHLTECLHLILNIFRSLKHLKCQQVITSKRRDHKKNLIRVDVCHKRAAKIW